jgi:polysaccharide biosynthesis transport protein
MAVDLHTPRHLSRDPALRARAAAARSEDVDWLGLRRTIWRRKLFLLGFVAIVTGLAMVYARSLTPIYEAEVLLMIDDRQPRLVDIQDVTPNVPANEQGAAAEAILIESRQTAKRLTERLNLHLLPEFNPALGNSDGRLAQWLYPLWMVPADWVEALPEAITRFWFASPTAAGTDLHAAERLQDMIVESVYRSIIAQTARGSNVLSVRFVSSDPELAALAANTVAELHIESQLDLRRSASARAGDFLEEEIRRLRESVDQGEAAIEAYRRQTGLIDGGGPALDTQQLSQLSTQMVMARGERAAAEARLQQVQRLLGGGGVEMAAELLDYPAIAELKSRELDLRRRLAELSSQYGERHPTMVNLQAEFEELQERLGVEVGRIVQRLRDEVQVARSQEAAIQARLDEIKTEVADFGRAEIPLRALEREAAAQRSLLEAYIGRAAEVASQRQVAEPDTRIVSEAVAPFHPIHPRKTTIVALALFGSLLVGSLAVFGMEQMDRTLRSGEQVESLLGVTALGLVPAVSGRRVSPESYAIERPSSPFAEALRNLRTSILVGSGVEVPRTVLLTSSVAEEGKTATALARLNAISGRRTVIVDCDLRRARLHTALGAARGEGLSELLSERAGIDDVLRSDLASGASFVTAGTAVTDPTTLLASPRLHTVLAELRERFDLVLLDSPPVLVVSDARVISPAVDATVFLIRWGHTQRQEAMLGIKHLAEAGARIAGACLTRVDVRQHARYGYADSGHYYDDKYVKYYQQ